MALPVPYFGYSKTGLTIVLNNLSYNAPTAYQWEFGDGGVSTEKSPTHTYTEEGFYEISLTVSNIDGESEPLIIVIGVGDMPDTLNSTIPELVQHYIPTALTAEASKEEIFNYINYWQSYLQPLVSDPDEIPVEHTHNEMRWPPLANMLIAQLSAYSVLMTSLNKFIIANGQKGMESNSGSTDSNLTVVPRQIKSIETGPTKTEWYEGKVESNTSEDFKNIASAFGNLFGANGPLIYLTGGICQLASRLMIYLPMCENPSNATVPPIVVGRRRNRVLGITPFGIVNERLIR